MVVIESEAERLEIASLLEILLDKLELSCAKLNTSWN